MENQPANQTRPYQSDKSYLFAIKRIDISTAQEIVVDFTPNQLEVTRNRQGEVDYQPMIASPVLNNDRDYFTPTFLLRNDQLKLQRYPENIKLFHNMHSDKFIQTTAESAYEAQHEPDLYLPRPSSSKYCHVCRACYDDYLTHTTMQSHKSNVRNNKFWIDICKLCNKMAVGSQGTKIMKTNKEKPIRKARKTTKRSAIKSKLEVDSSTLECSQNKN